MTHGCTFTFLKNMEVQLPELFTQTRHASIPTSSYVGLFCAQTVLSRANPAPIFHVGIKAGFPPGATVIWLFLLLMLEVKVIIVTHGNPGPQLLGKQHPRERAHRKSDVQGFDRYTLTVPDMGPRTHYKRVCKLHTHRQLHRCAHKDMLKDKEGLPGLSLTDL